MKTIEIFLWAVRFVIPLLAGFVIYKCFESLLRNRRDEQSMAILVNLETEETFHIRHWENSIGRAKTCDIVLADATVSRSHAVLARRTNGWYISDSKSKSGVYQNGEKITIPTKVNPQDVFTIGLTRLLIRRADIEEREAFINPKRAAARLKTIKAATLMWLVTFFQIITFIQMVWLCEPEYRLQFAAIFGGTIIFEWIFFSVSTKALKRKNFEIEAMAMLLSGVGMIVVSNKFPKQLIVQAVTFVIGIILYELIIWFIRDMKRVMKFRRWIGALALALLAATLVLGTVRYGARNWIDLGFTSIQPSEFVKIAFIFAGASTLNRLQEKDSLALFLGFCGLCIVALFLMRDFGSAVIFFMTFILIAFMRSGDFRTIILTCAAVGIGTFMIIQFRPYIVSRFMSWRHAWEYSGTTGYQPVMVNIATASGGLFGNGIGRGWLKIVAAAESDLVFGMLCEEWGLIFALIVACVFPMLALTTYRYAPVSRSAFYSITSCAAAGMLLFQACLNIFGSADVLPLTGVTLPLVSHGGSSLISVWGLLAFIKASDERTYNKRPAR